MAAGLDSGPENNRRGQFVQPREEIVARIDAWDRAPAAVMSFRTPRRASPGGINRLPGRSGPSRCVARTSTLLLLDRRVPVQREDVDLRGALLRQQSTVDNKSVPCD